MSAITKDCQFTLKPESVKVKRYQRVIPSLGNNPSSGYNMGDTVIFYLPGGLPNNVMDGKSAYLRFTLDMALTATGGDVAANAQAMALDYTASSIIRRLDIYGPGGALISSVDRYNTLLNGLYDVSHSMSELKGLSTLVGCEGTNSTLALSRLGRELSNGAEVTDGNTGHTQFTFAIPLIGPLFSNCDKYIPIYAMNSDIKIEVVLDTQASAFVIPAVVNSTVKATIFNPTIIVDFLEFDPRAVEQMKSLYGNELVLHCQDWHTYESTILNGTVGSYNNIVPSKVMSAKAALLSWRRLPVTGVSEGYTQSSRTNPFTGYNSTLNLTVGGQRIPQRPITTNSAGPVPDVSEYFAELQKSFHALNRIEFSGTLPVTTYASAQDVAVGDLPSTRGFLAGINLDTLQGQSDVLLTGTDLSKVTTYVDATFTNAITGDQTLDVFILHDSLLVIDASGSMTARW